MTEVNENVYNTLFCKAKIGFTEAPFALCTPNVLVFKETNVPDSVEEDHCQSLSYNPHSAFYLRRPFLLVYDVDFR